MKETEKELKIQIQILEATQKDIAKKNNGNLKVGFVYFKDYFK